MKEIVINKGKLKDDEITEVLDKARIVLRNDDGEFILSHFERVYFLPGGKVEVTETPVDTVKRELLEETNIHIMLDDISPFVLVKNYLRDYESSDGTIVNRLVNTYYFTGFTSKDDIEYFNLTRAEKRDDLRAFFVSMEDAKELLKEYKQEHINKFIDEIGDEKAEELIEQIHTIDFHQITELYNNTKKTIEFKESKIEPLKYLDKAKLTFEQTQRFDELGSDVVKKGQYAVVTMAGGQGTRLGHNGPKGTFKLDVYGKGKYLFEILVDNLKEANQKYGITINWYIMTSKENNSATIEFLEKNNYFGYDKNFVKIFTQSEMPLIDTEGKLLMGKDYKIREASDGNGGTYSSLRRSGCLADMKEKGIKWVFIGSVDNALLKMVDVTLLGMAIDKGVQIASKSVVKANPHERVGVFCKMNGHPKVIEYTELPEKMAEEVDSDGELKYGESHIMCNLYTIDAIEKISKETLMYHSAFKKNAYIDENGKEIIPTEPNSYKFESFIFDAFEFFDDIAILRGKREDDFAPVKNKDGVDSPKTAKELYEKYWNKMKK